MPEIRDASIGDGSNRGEGADVETDCASSLLSRLVVRKRLMLTDLPCLQEYACRWYSDNKL